MKLRQKIFFYTIVLLVTQTFSFGQLPDSVKVKLNNARQDTAKTRILVDYCKKDNTDSMVMVFGNAVFELINKNSNDAALKNIFLGYKVDVLLSTAYYITFIEGNVEEGLKRINDALSIARSINDKQRLSNALCSLQDIYNFRGEFEKLKSLLDTCFLLQGQLKDTLGLVSTWCNLGNYYTGMGKSDSTIICFKKAYDCALAAKDRTLQATMEFAIGFGLLHKGNINESLPYFFKSIKSYEDLGKPDDAYAAYQSVGVVYFQLQEYNKALSFLDKSITLAEKKHDSYYLTSSYNYKGNVLKYLDKNDASNQSYQKAIDLARQVGMGDVLISAIINMGTNYIFMKDTARALACFYQSIAENKEGRFKENLQESYFHLGETYLGKNKVDSAYYYAREAEKLAQSLHFASAQKQAEFLLSSVYKKMGDYKNAMIAYERFIDLRDSMNNNEAYRTAVEKQFQHEAEKKELVARAEREKKDIEIKAQKNKVIIASAAFAIIMVMGGGLVYVNRKRKENIFRRNLAESEMKALRAQMNPHFMFNSLNAIQQMVLNNDNENAFNYLDTYSKLTRKILENSEKKWITVDDEIKFLKLYLSIESLRFQHSFAYEIKVDDSVSVHSDKIPAMVVQPYVENAIKHGLLPKEGEQKLLISMSVNADDNLEIIVEDNGVGRRHAGTLKTDTTHKSMGMTITENRLRLLEGKNENKVFIEDLVTSDGTASGTKVHILINQESSR